MTRMRKLFLVAAAFVAAVTAIGAPTASAAPAFSIAPDTVARQALSPNVTQGPYSIVDLNSKKCLLVQGAAERSPATQFQCVTSYDDQRWWLDYIGTNNTGDYWHIRNVKSNMCLVVQGQDERTQAISTQCDTPDNRFIDQMFYRLRIVDGNNAFVGYAFVDYNSGKCLVAQGSDDGSPVFQTQCLDSNGNWIGHIDAIWELGN